MSHNIIDAQFKDNSPLKTVDIIKKILEKNNISVTETWSESGVSYCYSLKLKVDGTNFGVNGKGLTKDFALASAYGELMERMQLGLFGDSSVQKLGHFDNAVGDDFLCDVNSLYEDLHYWYDFLASKVNELDKSDIDGKELLCRYADENKKIKSTKFFNIVNGKTVCIPRELRCITCGSNGGAAGNTAEEAIVQAISEIIERHFKQRAINEKIVLDDIPEEVLKNFDTAYKIITELRNKGYRVILKDCSLGTRFPVVCALYINEKTGKYHTHFGAYPILEIAIERTLTESFQGRKIDSFAKNENFIYTDKELFSYKNIYNELKKGNYEKTTDFFVGNVKYPFNENVGFSGKTNKELLAQLIEYFDNQGYDIFVRDASSLGFPTYNVFIPKLSEVIFHSISTKHNVFSNANASVNALRNLSKATFEDYFTLLSHISEMKKLSNVDKRLFSFSTCSKLPIEQNSGFDSYLLSVSLAYVYYNFGNYSDALSFVDKAITCTKEENLGFLLCLKRYLSMVLNNFDSEKIKSLLKYFHNGETFSSLYSYIDNGLNPLDKLILKCNGDNCENCFAFEHCKENRTKQLINLVNENAKKLDFESFTDSMKKYTIK